jgi:hypothetical protein
MNEDCARRSTVRGSSSARGTATEETLAGQKPRASTSSPYWPKGISGISKVPSGPEVALIRVPRTRTVAPGTGASGAVDWMRPTSRPVRELGARISTAPDGPSRASRPSGPRISSSIARGSRAVGSTLTSISVVTTAVL